MFECAFAALLAALRRSSLYGVVRRKEKRPFVISNSMQPVSGSFLRLLAVKHRLAHILRFLLPVPCKRSSALLHADTLFYTSRLKIIDAIDISSCIITDTKTIAKCLVVHILIPHLI